MKIGCAWTLKSPVRCTKGKLMIYFTMRSRNEANKLYYVYVNDEFEHHRNTAHNYSIFRRKTLWPLYWSNSVLSLLIIGCRECARKYRSVAENLFIMYMLCRFCQHLPVQRILWKAEFHPPSSHSTTVFRYLDGEFLFLSSSGTLHKILFSVAYYHLQDKWALVFVEFLSFFFSCGI